MTLGLGSLMPSPCKMAAKRGLVLSCTSDTTMRSQPIPQISLGSARDYAWRAYVAGSDAATYHGDCLKPVDRLLRGVQSLALAGVQSLQGDDWDYADGYGWIGPAPFGPPVTRTVAVRVRCRKCANCLRQKRRMWTARAIDELGRSMRTWFGTLTVSPERRFHAMMLADRAAQSLWNAPLSSASQVDRTKLIAKQLLPECTRWLKRVRKESKAPLRYCLVAEAHKDGFPHFHLLLHERGQPVTKRALEGQWRYGISHFRLVPIGEVKHAFYVCKYISKSPQTRIRASRGYGQQWQNGT